MKKMNSLLVNKGFQTSKCKTQLRLGTARIKLLRNKKGEQIVSGRKEVADLLRNGQENNARLRVQQVIREQDLIEAYDLLNVYAEQIAAQLSVIDSQKTCPPDLKEDISTLLYVSSRCAELTDFAQIHPMFVAKYGKEFVSAAIELRPGCGVSAKVVEKLSSNDSTGEKKLKLMKEIAKEHHVDWDPAQFESEIRGDQNDVLPGPMSILVDDFPSVPNQKPTLGTHVSQSENATNSVSGRFDKVEPTNSPRPGDFRTNSSGALTRTGPPSRKPPGRDQSRSAGLTSDERPPDIDPGSKETQSRRNQRRESDSFLGPSPQRRYDVEESRRNSIGVPREKSFRTHAGSAHAGVDESSLQDQKTNNLRDAGADDYEEADHRKGRHEVQDSRRDSIGVPREKSVRARAGVDESSLQDHKKHNLTGAAAEDFNEAGRRKGNHGREYESESNGRQSQKFAGKEVSEKRRPQYQDQNADDDHVRRPPSREGSGKGRSQHQDQYADEEKIRGPPNREGSGKGRPQHEEQYADEEVRGPYNKEGSGKRRSQHEEQYANEEKVRRPSNRESLGKGRPQHEDQYADEEKIRGPPNREGSGKGRSQDHDQYAEDDKVRRPSNREGLDKRRPQHEEQYADEEKVRGPLNREGYGRGRPQYQDQYAEDDKVRRPSNRESLDMGRPQHEEQYADEEKVRSSNRESSRKGRPHHEDQYADVEEVRGPAKREGFGTERPQHRDQYADNDKVRKASNREDSGMGRPQHEDRRATMGPEEIRHGRPQYEDQYADNDKVRKASNREDSGKGRPQHEDRRATMGPEEIRHGRPQYEDQYADNDKVRKASNREDSGKGRPQHEDRRATMGPEEIRHGRPWETEDSPRSRFGEREKQVESRRQSAPLPKEDVTEGCLSQRDKPERRRNADIPAVDRPSRFGPQVNVQKDDEDLPSTRVSRDRFNGQRKVDPARYDDGRPPPRFIKVGNLDDEDVRASPTLRGEKPQRFVTSNDQSAPRPRSNLESAKTDPALSGTPKISTVPEHRKTHSAFSESASKPSTQRLQKPSPEDTHSPRQPGQSPFKPPFMAPPDLDSLILMFGKKNQKK